MDDDEGVAKYDDIDGDEGGESWLAEQARLILVEDGG